MSRRIRTLLLGAVLPGLLAAGTGIGVLGLSGPVLAASVTPGWEPDDQALGAVTFYDANGDQVTSGKVDAHPFAAYAVTSGPGRPGDAKALLQIFTPTPGVNPGNWQMGDQLTATTDYPPERGPDKIRALRNVAIASGAATDLSLGDFIGEFPNTLTDPAYQNMYEVRVKTSAPLVGPDIKYFRADIQVDPVTGTWRVVYSNTTGASSGSPSGSPSESWRPPLHTTPRPSPSPSPQGTTGAPATEASSESPSPTPTGDTGIPANGASPSLVPVATEAPSPTPAPGVSFVPMANPSGPIGGPVAQGGAPANMAAVGGLSLLLLGTGLVAVLRRVLRDEYGWHR